MYAYMQVRLLTGIGRFYEMAYILQILMENDQFESLLHTGLEKVDHVTDFNLLGSVITTIFPRSVAAATFFSAPQVHGVYLRVASNRGPTVYSAAHYNAWPS